MRAPARIDLPTVAGIAAVVGVVSTQFHEALGHGGACLALGRHLKEWGAFYVDCNQAGAPLSTIRLVAAAGNSVNLVLALICLEAFRLTPPTRPRLYFFLWLMTAVNAFNWAGYFLFSGVSGIGDWGAGKSGVFVGVAHWAAWRVLLAVGGFALYFAATIALMRTLARRTGSDDAGRADIFRLCWTAYFTIGVSALAIGLLNPIGLFILLGSAVASSFGGPSGLLWGPSHVRGGIAVATPFVLPRSWAWIVAGVAMVAVDAVVLGPSLHF